MVTLERWLPVYASSNISLRRMLGCVNGSWYGIHSLDITNAVLIPACAVAIIILLVKYHNSILPVILTTVIGLLIWFFTVPNFRFSYGLLFATILLTLAYYLVYFKFKFSFKSNVIYCLLWFPILLILPQAFKTRGGLRKPYPQVPTKVMQIKVLNSVATIDVFEPSDSNCNTCFNQALPCTYRGIKGLGHTD